RFSNPSVTPSTMLAIRLRVSPCSARCSPRSVGRSTVSVPSDWVTFIPGLTAWLNSPLGPLTDTRPGLISTVTPSGMDMGFLPIRLMKGFPASVACLEGPATCDQRLPHVRHYLAAYASLPRLVP